MVTIEEFLRMFRSANTQRSYQSSLTQFFDVVGIPPSEYFNNGRRYEDDVVAFLSNLEKKGMTSKSIECKMGAVRSYLLENDVELKRRFWKRLHITGESVTKDRLFTKEELRMIFNHMDIVGHAVASVQLSTGLRLDDVLQLFTDFVAAMEWMNVYLERGERKNTHKPIQEVLDIGNLDKELL